MQRSKTLYPGTYFAARVDSDIRPGFDIAIWRYTLHLLDNMLTFFIESEAEKYE